MIEGYLSTHTSPRSNECEGRMIYHTKWEEWSYLNGYLEKCDLDGLENVISFFITCFGRGRKMEEEERGEEG